MEKKEDTINVHNIFSMGNVAISPIPDKTRIRGNHEGVGGGMG